MLNPKTQASVEQLTSYLEGLGLEPSAIDLADLLWLVLSRSVGAGATENSAPLEEQLGDYEVHRAEPGEGELPKEKTASGTAQPRPPVSDQVPLYPYEQQAIERDEALPLSIPLPTALAGQLDLARALRPLCVRVPMPQRMELDEEASAQQIAETRIWAPVLRPQTTRWLDVTLVVDTAPAMQIWQRTIDQLQRLLECHGAFRNVRRWHLNTDLAETFTLTLPGAADVAQGRSPRELIDPSGRRLILVISDCVAPAWRSGSVIRLLENLAHHNSIALVQVLPYKLWERSTLGRYPEALIGVGKPGEASARLPAKPRRRSFRERVRGTPLPVISIEAQGFRELARLIAGQGGTQAGGVLLQTAAEPQAGPPEQTPLITTLLASFKLQASEEAKQLARALTVTPLSIPFIHLVHHHSVVSPTLAQIAEVLLSGLIYRARPLHGADEITYDFVKGAREVLSRDLLPGQGLGLMRRIAEYISEHSGRPNSFRAMLADPSQVDPAEVWAMHPDFTAIAVDYLLQLGGRYSEIGRLLAQTDRQLPSAPQATNEANTSPKAKAVDQAQSIRIMERRSAVDRHLQRFTELLNLSFRDKEAILFEFSNFREKAFKEFTRTRVLDIALFGSIARDTAIHPLSDIDILVLYGAESQVNPVEIYRELEHLVRTIYSGMEVIGATDRRSMQKERLHARFAARPKLSSIGASVVVNTGNATLEILPCIIQKSPRTGNNIIVVPDKDLLTWTATNHLTHNLMASELNDATAGNYRRLVRLIKYWHHDKFPDTPVLKGFVLECLVAQYIDHTITSISQNFSLIMRRILRERSSPLKFIAVPEPGKRVETKRTNLSIDQFNLLRDKIKETVTLLDNTLQATTVDEELGVWNFILGRAFSEFGAESSRLEKETNTQMHRNLQNELGRYSSFDSGRIGFNIQPRGIRLPPRRELSPEELSILSQSSEQSPPLLP